MLCGVSTPIIPHINNKHVLSPHPNIYPPPQLYPFIKKVCVVSPLSVDIFFYALSLPTIFCVFATLSSILDSKRSIKLALSLYLRVWHS